MENQQNNLTAIERALAAAKARKAARDAMGGGEDTAQATDVVAAPKAPRREIDPAALEARAAAKAQRDEERARRKAERATAAAQKGPSHMKKVDRARSKLPPLGDAAEKLYTDAVSGDSLSVGQIDALAQHLLVKAREMRTLRAVNSAQLPMGAKVRITGGDPKFIGAVGTVVHTQKLRAKVSVDGVKSPIYIYTGEAELTSDAG